MKSLLREMRAAITKTLNHLLNRKVFLEDFLDTCYKEQKITFVVLTGPLRSVIYPSEKNKVPLS